MRTTSRSHCELSLLTILLRHWSSVGMSFFKILWGISLHFLQAVASQTIPEFDWASVRCPQSALETLPTPTYGSSGGLFTVCTELIFNAPAVEIYHALLDFQAYSSFSSFVIDIELPPQIRKTPDDVFLGLEMTFTTRDIFPIINTTSLEIVTVMENSTDGEYMMTSWRYDDKLGGMFSRSEHPSILVEQSDGATRYISFETYYNDPGTYLLLPVRKQLQEGYARHGADLKAYVEGLWRG